MKRLMTLLFLFCFAVFNVFGVDHNSVLWEYSSGLQLEKMTEFADTENPRVTEFVYGLSGQVDDIIKPDGTKIHYVYDFKDRLKHYYASDGSFLQSFQYDLDDQVKPIDDRVTSTIPHQFEVKNEFDAVGKKVRSNLPDGSSILFEYEGNELVAVRRISVSGEELYCHLYQWNEEGKLKKSILPNEKGEISYRWEYKGRIQKIESPYWSEEIPYSGYESSGNLNSSTINDSRGSSQWSYSYDKEGRLTNEANTNGFLNAFSYDILNNITAISGKEREVDIYNQTLITPDANYSYDGNGNLKTKASDKETIHFRYDALDRLIEVTIEQQQKYFYAYDSNHRRLKKTVQNWNAESQEWENDTTFYFIYDGSNEIGCMDEEGNIIELRILGHGLGAEIGAAIAIEIEGYCYIPIHDHRGNVTCLVDMQTGAITETYRYTAFGNEEIYNASGKRTQTSINPWHFYSKRFDAETHLTFFGKRYYSSDLGKWITPDPLGYSENANRYVFVNNNPINCIDMYGLFSISAFWQGAKTTAKEWFEAFKDHVGPKATVEDFDNNVKEFFRFFLGDGLFSITDYFSEPHKFGITGGDKGNGKIKITFINGILNSSEIETIIDKISNAHNGQSIHWIYRGSGGWTQDILKAVLMKLSGVISDDAYQLAMMWKQLIKEMGGTESGGTIIHYAHSIGATETLRARKLLSPEEQQMIQVIALGPATIIPDEGFQSVVNYVSRRDGVCIIGDPISYIHALLTQPEHVIFLGAHSDGYPIVDHLFQVYWNYLKDVFENS